ncbi:MAG: hypothetical protein J2P57_15160 [Acidimicrobiaceae bacterium]|nr:hypothetical protein [Acidimicrobiaceae bacterium]
MRARHFAQGFSEAPTNYPVALPGTVTRRRSAAPVGVIRLTAAAGWMRTTGWRPLVIFTASRLLAMAAVGVAISTKQGFAATRFAGPWPKPPSGPLFIQALAAWDGGWYTSIAGHGYGASLTPHTASVGFFPLLPSVIRIVGATGLGVLLAGALVVFVVGGAASIALWLLTAEVCDRQTADRAVALWAFWPGAFVLSMIYSEGLTVLLACICLRALLRRSWVVAGVAAGLATATAPTAVVLLVCCAWVVIPALWRGVWRAGVTLLLAPLGIVGYFLYLYARSGDLFLWFRVEHTYWQAGTGVRQGFYDTVVFNWRSFLSHPHFLRSTEPALGILVAAALLVLLLWWRPPAVLVIWTVGVVILALSSAPVGLRPRIFLVAFPLIIALARALRGALHVAVLACEAALMGLLFVVALTVIPGVIP